VASIREAGWKADPDLRPEGKSGPLARSMGSYIEYWQRWAQTWEFQSLLRSRFVAGDESLGRRFLSNAAEVAYPERLTFEQVAAIRRMRVRMEEERVRPKDARRFHFKLGYGSLADVQWAVELSLMRHGFAQPGVRRTNTLEALEALAAAKLVEDSVARSLAQAHVFLTEVKAAGIDVVAEAGRERGVEVVLAANDIVPLPGEPDLDAELRALAEAATAEPVAT